MKVWRKQAETLVGVFVESSQGIDQSSQPGLNTVWNQYPAAISAGPSFSSSGH